LRKHEEKAANTKFHIPSKSIVEERLCNDVGNEILELNMELFSQLRIRCIQVIPI